MKDLFNKTSTTSIVAVLIILLGMGLLYAVTLFNLPEDNTRATQVITGTFGLLTFILGYYFSASKQRAVTQQAETITNSPAVGGDNPQ